MLGAETEGMIGYMIEQELGNLLPFEVPFATLLTMVEVDPDDPGFQNPTKFVGPVYEKAEADRIAAEKGWVFKQDGDKWRRVVPSPLPKRIFEIRPIKWLLEQRTIVICAGGGGIPTMYEPGADRKLVGVEAVIDKDVCSELLARELGADLFVMATDAEAVFVDWGTPKQRAIHRANPDSARRSTAFPAGSMGPKVEAACQFALATGQHGGDRRARRHPGDRARRKGDVGRQALRGSLVSCMSAALHNLFANRVRIRGAVGTEATLDADRVQSAPRLLGIEMQFAHPRGVPEGGAMARADRSRGTLCCRRCSSSP